MQTRLILLTNTRLNLYHHKYCQINVFIQSEL